MVQFTFALLKKGVNMKPNMMDEKPYRMNSRNRRKMLAFWKTWASGSRMMQTSANRSTYVAYTLNQDNLKWKYRIVQITFLFHESVK